MRKVIGVQKFLTYSRTVLGTLRQQTFTRLKPGVSLAVLLARSDLADRQVTVHSDKEHIAAKISLNPKSSRKNPGLEGKAPKSSKHCFRSESTLLTQVKVELTPTDICPTLFVQGQPSIQIFIRGIPPKPKRSDRLMQWLCPVT